MTDSMGYKSNYYGDVFSDFTYLPPDLIDDTYVFDDFVDWTGLPHEVLVPDDLGSILDIQPIAGDEMSQLDLVNYQPDHTFAFGLNGSCSTEKLVIDTSSAASYVTNDDTMNATQVSAPDVVSIRDLTYVDSTYELEAECWVTLPQEKISTMDANIK